MRGVVSLRALAAVQSRVGGRGGIVLLIATQAVGYGGIASAAGDRRSQVCVVAALYAGTVAVALLAVRSQGLAVGASVAIQVEVLVALDAHRTGLTNRAAVQQVVADFAVLSAGGPGFVQIVPHVAGVAERGVLAGGAPSQV